MRREKLCTRIIAAVRITGRNILQLGTLFVLASTAMSLTLSAQVYPTFTTGGKTALTTDAAPVLSYLGDGKAVMAYRGAQTGTLQVSTSADGITWSSPVDTGVRTNDSIAISNLGYPDYTLYVLVHTGGSFQYMTSSDGITFTPPRPVALSNGGRAPDGAFKPGLVFYADTLYLSLVETAAPGSPATVDVLTTSDGGQSFSSLTWLSDIPTDSGSSLAIYDPPNTRQELISLAYTTGSDRHLVLRLYNNADIPVLSSWYTSQDTTRIAGTPRLIQFSPPGTASWNLYIFGRATDEDSPDGQHHFVAVGSPDGSTFEPVQTYSQTLQHAPAVGYAGSLLLVAFESAGGHKIQTFIAPPETSSGSSARTPPSN